VFFAKTCKYIMQLLQEQLNFVIVEGREDKDFRIRIITCGIMDAINKLIINIYLVAIRSFLFHMHELIIVC